MLPRAARIQKNRDFRAVYRRKRFFAGKLLVLHLLKVHEVRDVPLRLGFVISKKSSRKSHDRNRLKRRLREICRTKVIPVLKEGCSADVLFVARSGAAEAEFQALLVEVNQLCRTAGLL
jgi:ribonuclease P protein component